MHHYPRKPALFILAAIAGVAALILRPHASPGADPATWSLAQLQSAIADDRTATGPVWVAYGNRLADDHQFAHAADAFERALQLDAKSTDARIGQASALARLGDTARLQRYLQQLLQTEPKLTEDLFDRPEFQPYLNQSAFTAIKTEAHLQAMD